MQDHHEGDEPMNTTTTTASTPPARAVPTAPTPTAGTVLDLLDRARDGLLQACHSSTPADRYTQAHLAALRAASALIAARTLPSRRSRPRSVWEVLPTIAPELTEWAVFYAASGRRRLALERGSDVVTCRDADDLVRQGERFLDIVRATLHLPVADPLPAGLVATSAR